MQIKAAIKNDDSLGNTKHITVFANMQNNMDVDFLITINFKPLFYIKW